jgi:glycosyltransferase involved in cell wall biosynthesis
MNSGSSAYPRITIVTPNLNQAAHLEACLKSVLDQDYPNLEYIVVDGGSTDGSLAIIERYASRLHKWFSEPDDGPYHAIQKGFNCSSGEIMAWLNSDDKYHDGALFAMAETFRRFPDVHWLTGYPTEYTNGGVAINRITLPWARWSRYRYLTWDFGFIQQESTCWRRELWEKAGGTLDLDRKFAADLELWARFFRHARLHTTTCLIGGFRYTSDQQRSRAFRSQYLAECRAVIQRERRALSWPARAGLSLLRVAGWPLGAAFFVDIPILRAPYRVLFRIPRPLSYDFERQAYIRGGRTIRYPQLFVFGRGFRDLVSAACAILRPRRLRDTVARQTRT